ncbi:OmpA family protein [Spirosoma sp. BT702]|uniref:OmpA family protein n=1 Tax=Spirosoma profusum TaxID=2771354 RepID=A0A926Y3Q9_9BACT|nr:OmpA family protein [Spirosoma profusum]MBD2704372.1 OmpA family protein [Spirosoma profusum]
MFANKTPWIILLILWMLGSTWWHVCKIKQLCVEDAQPSVTTSDPEATTPPGADGYTIADGNLFRLDFPGQFTFAKSGANANMNSLGGSLDELTAYLKKNPGRNVEVIGYYVSDESNTTSFANLGLARAEGMKQYMVQQGIPAASITTKGVERNMPYTAKGDSLVGGLDFAFSGGTNTTPVDETTAATAPEPATTSAATTPPAILTLTGATTERELAESQKFKSIFEPIDLYFPLAEANYIKTAETVKFFEEAIHYLADHKDKKLQLTGHTDDSGPDDVNMRLSRDRANDVKARLRKAGVSSSQIEIRAKGETEPKADNSTMSGRKANRRVSVVVL